MYKNISMDKASERHANQHHGAIVGNSPSISYSSRSSMCLKNLKCDMPAVAGVMAVMYVGAG